MNTLSKSKAGITQFVIKSCKENSLTLKTRSCYNKWSLEDLGFEGLPSDVQFSSCGSMIAVAYGNRLQVWSVKLKELLLSDLHTHWCVYEIEDMQWSYDSQLIMLVSLKYCRVEVVRLKDKEWLYQVTNPIPVGLSSSKWVPDNKHILLNSSLNVYSIIHSIEGGTSTVLPSVHAQEEFSSDGKYLAVIQFIVASYRLVLISTSSWKILWETKIDCLIVCGLCWSIDSQLICIWNNTTPCILQIFNLMGKCSKSIEMALPITIVKFSPCRKILAVACTNNQVYLYNTLTWQHAVILHTKDEDMEKDFVCLKTVLQGDKLQLPCCPSERSTTFSSCGKFLTMLSHNGQVYIWDILEYCNLCFVLEGAAPNSSVLWHPTKPYLAINLGTGTVLMWKHSKTASLHLVEEGTASTGKIQWLSHDTIAILARNSRTPVTILYRMK